MAAHEFYLFRVRDPISDKWGKTRYKITDQIEIALEGINLTDDYRDRWTDEDANRNYEYNHFGRTILFGARFKM